MIDLFLRVKSIFLSLVMIPSLLSAALDSCCPSPESPAKCLFKPEIDCKIGYFFFTDSQLRRIYDRGGVDIQLSSSISFWNHERWTLQLYGALEYFHRSGRSLNQHQHTKVWSIPFNLGIKQVYAIDQDLNYYFALGPRYFYIHQHNDSSEVDQNRSKNGLGLFVNTGFNYLFCEGFILDLFGEYSYAEVHFHSGKSRVYTSKTQIGGFTIGGGLGYEF